MSATIHSFANGEKIELPLPLLERIVEKAEYFHRPQSWQSDIITLHRAWMQVLQPFGGTLDNHPAVVCLRERLQVVVDRSGIFVGELTPRADDPARLIYKLKQELAAA